MVEKNFCLNCIEEKGPALVCPNCGYKEGTAPESALHLPPGTILQEKYLIGRALGQGGFGITYIAYDLNLNIKLAIKEYLPQELAYRTGGQSGISIYKKSLAENFNYGLEKYLEEARTLARFNEHPNIVSVRDFFKANGTAYIVMDYIEGITLKEYLESRQEPLSFEQALNIFMPVLDALKEVHAAGILHRDISPDNLLIDAKGRVVLIDFGAARQAMGEQSRSMSVIMKAGYSPIEQYQSKGKQGPWTDVYAVATTFYLAITGQMPPESLDRIGEDNLVPPSELGITIEPHQQQALNKAMAILAKDRYQTVEEFQNSFFASSAVKASIAEKGTLKGLQSIYKSSSGDKDLLYLINYDGGGIPVGELPVGSRLVDLTWQWEFRTGNNYTGSGEIKPVIWTVVAKNHYKMKEPHITIVSEEIIGKYCFDDRKRWLGLGKIGNNIWSMSGSAVSIRGLRPWLNSKRIHSGEGFYIAFPESFKKCVILTTIPNYDWETGNYYLTRDYVFIPSSTELGDFEHQNTHPIGSVYPYYVSSKRELRISQLNGKSWGYWTRSPASHSIEDNFIRSVYNDGKFFNYSSTSYGGEGVRPALNIKAEVKVSKKLSSH